MSKSTNISKTKEKQVFEDFIAKHPDGKMRQTDFRNMVNNLFPGKISKNLEKQVFKMYDTSNDGFIDFPEFLVVYAIMKDGKPEDKLRSVFKVIDINNDGWITINELKRLVKVSTFKQLFMILVKSKG